MHFVISLVYSLLIISFTFKSKIKHFHCFRKESSSQLSSSNTYEIILNILSRHRLQEIVFCYWLHVNEKISREATFRQSIIGAYSELCQTSTMKRFAKVVNDEKPLTIFAKRLL